MLCANMTVVFPSAASLHSCEGSKRYVCTCDCFSGVGEPTASDTLNAARIIAKFFSCGLRSVKHPPPHWLFFPAVEIDQVSKRPERASACFRKFAIVSCLAITAGDNSFGVEPPELLEAARLCERYIVVCRNLSQPSGQFRSGPAIILVVIADTFEDRAFVATLRGCPLSSQCAYWTMESTAVATSVERLAGIEMLHRLDRVALFPDAQSVTYGLIRSTNTSFREGSSTSS